MIKHNKQMKGAFKHLKKTGDTEPLTRLLIEQSIKSVQDLPKKIRTIA